VQTLALGVFQRFGVNKARLGRRFTDGEGCPKQKIYQLGGKYPAGVHGRRRMGLLRNFFGY
ncbi:hypothetical protein, partial [Propionivibrio sp.]|uniref:hypothetical protein n=1 Tax=Propionivibrio sp. TaxID=2212460 RepID=UPI003BF09550